MYDYNLFTRVEDLENMVDAFCDRPSVPVSFDTETTDRSFLDARFVSWQFMQFGYIPALFDVRHWPSPWLRRAGKALDRLFHTNQIVGMNLSFDWKFIRHHTGATIVKPFDVMVVQQVIKGLGITGGKNKGVSFNLKGIASYYKQGVSKEERSAFVGMDSREDEWYGPFREETLSYMAQDVAVLEPIYRCQQEELTKRKLHETARLENWCLPAVAWIEYNGVHIAEDQWRAYIKKRENEAKEWEEKAMLVLGEAVAQARAKRFLRLSKAYERWRALFEKEVQAAVDAWYDLCDKAQRLGLDGEPAPVKGEECTVLWKEREYTAKWDGKKYVGWSTFKKDWLGPWREANPNPGEPKEETGVPADQWDVNDARRLTYAPFNIGSPAQLLEAFHELGIPVDSTGKDALDELPDGEYEAVDILKAWRSANTIVTKFGEKLLSAIHTKTGRIHPSYWQIGADTGRSSCSNPPWQQIPSIGEDGAMLRSFVQALSGNVLLTADFSNIEMRILANETGDKNLLDAFARGVDMHSFTARMMFGLPEDFDVEHEHVPGAKVTYRKAAKELNFGLVYGMSASSLARKLKIDKETGHELMDKYFAAYPGVTRWLHATRQKAIKTCETRTVAGRVRYYELPVDTRSRDYKREHGAVERKAGNHPIQGSSADITKMALALFWDRVHGKRLDQEIRLIAVVHDELVVECPESWQEEAAASLAGAMDDACAHYMKRVAVPPTKVTIDRCWQKG